MFLKVFKLFISHTSNVITFNIVIIITWILVKISWTSAVALIVIFFSLLDYLQHIIELISIVDKWSKKYRVNHKQYCEKAWVPTGQKGLETSYVVRLWEKIKGCLREKDELTGSSELRSQSVVSVVEEDDPRERERWNRGDDSCELTI